MLTIAFCFLSLRTPCRMIRNTSRISRARLVDQRLLLRSDRPHAVQLATYIDNSTRLILQSARLQRRAGADRSRPALASRPARRRRAHEPALGIDRSKHVSEPGQQQRRLRFRPH